MNVSHVDFSYGQKEILRDFSLAFPKTGILALMGASGCGKTTLLRILAGLEQPQKGEVTRPKRIAMVFQEDRLLPWLTAQQNMALVADPSLPKGQVEQIAGELELTEVLDALPSQLSGGMQRRVAIGRALCHNAPLILLDEPFKGLDQELRWKVMDMVRANSKGKLTVLVTHDKEEAAYLADKTLSLQGPPLVLTEQTSNG